MRACGWADRAKSTLLSKQLGQLAGIHGDMGMRPPLLSLLSVSGRNANTTDRP